MFVETAKLGIHDQYVNALKVLKIGVKLPPQLKN
jgi:hypothetical protein